jgi:hypothetical protein
MFESSIHYSGYAAGFVALKVFDTSIKVSLNVLHDNVLIHGTTQKLL